MELLNSTDPIVIVIITGLVGGFVHCIYKQHQGKVDDTLSLWIWLKYGLFGIVAAFIVWGVGEATNNAVGITVIALISGLGGPYLVDKFVEGRDAHQQHMLAVEQLADENDSVQALVKLVNGGVMADDPETEVDNE